MVSNLIMLIIRLRLIFFWGGWSTAITIKKAKVRQNFILFLVEFPYREFLEKERTVQCYSGWKNNCISILELLLSEK